MLRIPFLLLNLPLVAASGLCQTVLSPEPSQTHRLATAQTITLPIKCDSDGNMYFRNPSNSPSTFDLIKIAKDGTQKAAFRYYEAPDLKRAFVEDFAVGDDGKVFELAQVSREKIFVLRFSSDGQLEGHVELLTTARFEPSQFVVTSDGSFFVSGTKLSHEGGGGRPLNFIFNGSGKLVREVSLKGDVDPDASPKVANGSTEPDSRVRFGSALPGQDGNVYLMRATSPAMIYVVSPGGDVARILKVKPPAPRDLPVTMMLNGPRLAIEFSDPDATDIAGTTIRVVNASTAETIRDYKIVRELSQALACYADDEFTFIGDTDGWPAIMQANAR